MLVFYDLENILHLLHSPDLLISANLDDCLFLVQQFEKCKDPHRALFYWLRPITSLQWHNSDKEIYLRIIFYVY